MKYLFLKSPDAKQNRLVPVDAPLSIEWHNGVAYLSCGGTLIIDVDKHNETALLPFLADAFNKCDVVTMNLSFPPGTTVKKGLEDNSDSPDF